MNWKLKTFEELTNHELYALLKLRSLVFVVEQNCVFQDMDDKDQQCLHLLGFEDGILAAYSRLLPAGVTYNEASIGRVVTDPAFRRKGAGKELRLASIDKLEEAFGKQPIRIGAQLYLEAFYTSFGFHANSEVYIEDGIPHIEMLRL